MDYYNFGTPTKKGDWHIFSDTILSQLQLSDCNDTIDGICHKTKNLQECIDLCSNDKCKTGYYIEAPDGQSFCAPLRSVINETSPYYRLRTKSYYPVLDNMKTYVFSNYPYPPNIPNAIFYTDHFSLKNIENNKFISFLETDKKISFTNTDSTHLQLLPKEIVQSNMESYIYVKNGDNIIISIPETSFSLQETNEKLDWIRSENLENNLQIFTKNKKIGEILNYDDEIYFLSHNNLVIYDSDMKTLVTKNINTSEASFFTLIPKVHVYYCENDECKSVSLDETDRKGISATYKGIPIQRAPTCWNICGRKKDVSNILIIILILIICIILFLYFLRKIIH